jgi:hypothetical protein
VLVNGKTFSLLNLTKAQNFASLSLGPLQAADPSGRMAITFRPRKVVVPKDVIPTIGETRELGVGLHRMRVRSIKAT